MHDQSNDHNNIIISRSYSRSCKFMCAHVISVVVSLIVVGMYNFECRNYLRDFSIDLSYFVSCRQSSGNGLTSRWMLNRYII